MSKQDETRNEMRDETPHGTPDETDKNNTGKQ